MGDTTKIEWTDATWNPLRGCSRVSEGCRHCYAESVAARFSGPGQPYDGLATRGPARWTGEVRLVEEHLVDPLRWTQPRRIFVNSMSDLFHEKVPDQEIDRIFTVMALALARGHTLQVLTKRPARMLAYVQRLAASTLVPCHENWPAIFHGPMRDLTERLGRGAMQRLCETPDVSNEWPLPNVWLGVSVEDQATADERIPLLLQTPAAKRFVSYEPALGPVDFKRWTTRRSDGVWLCCECCFGDRCDDDRHCDRRSCHVCGGTGALPAGLDWIIVGGESGPGARPFDVAWARSTIAQCRAASVACFVKQLGRRSMVDLYTDEARDLLDTYEDLEIVDRDGDSWRGAVAQPTGGNAFVELPIRDRKGGDMAEWPEDLCVREFPR